MKEQWLYTHMSKHVDNDDEVSALELLKTAETGSYTGFIGEAYQDILSWVPEHWQTLKLHISYQRNAIAQAELEKDERNAAELAELRKRQAVIRKEQEDQRVERERQRLQQEEKQRKVEEERRVKEVEALRLERKIQLEIKTADDDVAAQQERADIDRTSRQDALWTQLRRIVNTDYLSLDSFFNTHPDKALVGFEEFQEAKCNFVKHWIKKHTPADKKGEKYTPDDEQTAVIAAIENKIQVIARAGSGKTTTLGGRAFFLIKHCGVDPAAMLLLAFNSKAAMEMKRRLLLMLCPAADELISEDIQCREKKQKRYGKINMLELEGQAIDSIAKEMGVKLPFIMTFHALAYAVVHPEEDILYDDETAGVVKQSRVIQDIIEDHIKSPETEAEIRELMMSHYKGEWETIIQGGFNIADKEEFLAYRRSLPCRCLKGHEAKSYGEKVIADFLFEHDVPYKYERNKNWNGINYRPDFTLFLNEEKGNESGIIIEYFGLTGDCDYDEMSDEKRVFWERDKDFKLIEFGPGDVRGRRGEFEDELKQTLEEEGFKCDRLSDDEIWKLIEDRAVGSFSKAMRILIGRCRKLSLTPQDLEKRILSHKADSEIEKQFIDLGLIFYREYLSRLENDGKEDFDGLIQRAITRIESGVTVFDRKSGGGDLKSLGYIFMDEFQDFSDLFFRLISSIQRKNTDVNLFAVGDDWQAINGFAGSDLRFFRNFDEYMGKAKECYISTNYRSCCEIVEIGNLLMDGQGKRARAFHETGGQITRVDAKSFQPSSFEEARHSGDFITPIVLRIIKKSLEGGSDVTLLSRRNDLPYYVSYDKESPVPLKGLDRYLNHIRSFLPDDQHGRVTISTAHKYKGLEKDTVVILDAVAKCYPLIHPDWVFTRMFGNSVETIIEEEQRLLYVALTRAEKSLYIITDDASISPILLEKVESRKPLPVIHWPNYPPLPDAGSMITIVLANQGSSPIPTTSIKDVIKQCGYGPKNNYSGWVGWSRLVKANDFDIKSLESEAWFDKADGVEVRILDESDEVQAVYHVNKAEIQQDETTK